MRHLPPSNPRAQRRRGEEESPHLPPHDKECSGSVHCHPYSTVIDIFVPTIGVWSEGGVRGVSIFRIPSQSMKRPWQQEESERRQEDFSASSAVRRISSVSSQCQLAQCADKFALGVRHRRRGQRRGTGNFCARPKERTLAVVQCRSAHSPSRRDDGKSEPSDLSLVGSHNCKSQSESCLLRREMLPSRMYPSQTGFANVVVVSSRCRVADYFAVFASHYDGPGGAFSPQPIARDVGASGKLRACLLPTNKGRHDGRERP